MLRSDLIITIIAIFITIGGNDDYSHVFKVGA